MKNRDLMVVNVGEQFDKKQVDKIKKNFQEEYPDYYVVVSGGLVETTIMIEITKINK